MHRQVELLVTCEHGGNGVPPLFAEIFSGATELLSSHRGWDPGALELARRFARHFEAPLFASTVTRLLVDLNRSQDNPTLFSSFIWELDETARQAILGRYYHPYRERVENYIRSLVQHETDPLHLSVHTFSPILDDQERELDIGLLYDPSREAESHFVDLWVEELGKELGFGWVVRRNQPYHGKMDGIAEVMRSTLPNSPYIGIELEVNQKFPLTSGSEWEHVQHDLVNSLQRVLVHLRNGS